MAPCARVKDAEVGAQPAFLRIAAAADLIRPGLARV